MRIQRLGPADASLAREAFMLMAAVFETEAEPLSDGYLQRLLAREDFWALAALDGDTILGGATAHTLLMTRSEAPEILLYDIAVRPDRQRQGIGRRLVETLRQQAAAAGIHTLWVPADNEDTHALDFYRALGGEPGAVTIFSFPG
jgi:aminoglycoside 3-N-acetyltransferase I